MRVHRLKVGKIEDLLLATGGNREFHPVPIGPREVAGELAMTKVGGLTLTHGKFSSDIHVSGTLSNDQLSIGIVLEAKGVRIFGKDAQAGNLEVVGAARDNDASYRSAIEYLVVNVDEERVVRMAEAKGWVPPPFGVLHGSDLFELEDRKAARLVRWATTVSKQLRNGTFEALGPEAEQSLADQIVREFTRGLSGASSKGFLGEEPRRCLPKVVRRAEDWLAGNPCRQPSIHGLSRHLDVSERQLFRAFDAEVGMSPARYLKRYRLTQARLELRAADPADTTVTDVAVSWGFWELGRFAVDYRRLFGECPSQSLRACARGESTLLRH